MPMTMTQTKTALTPGTIAYFLAVGGTGAVTYAVLPGGAGGTIDPVTGLYTPPATIQIGSDDPSVFIDTIQATDSTLATVNGTIEVGNALMMFLEILTQELGLPPERAFFWDQKIFQPTDAGLYLIVSTQRVKVFANNIRQAGTPAGWDQAQQNVNVMATLDINIISRDNSALFRKEEVVMALQSIYSQQQQEANSFMIGVIPAGSTFINLSEVDGAAIPYRFVISVNMQYTVTKQKDTPYFDDVPGFQIEEDEDNLVVDNQFNQITDNQGNLLITV